MLRYVGKEVDRLKELFKGKEAGLKSERDDLATSLEACQAELAAAHQDCGKQAAEAATQLKVRGLEVTQPGSPSSPYASVTWHRFDMYISSVIIILHASTAQPSTNPGWQSFTTLRQISVVRAAALLA